MWAQCTFKKKGKEEFTQCWIDSKHAKKGNFVQLLELGEEFWEITFVGKKVDSDPSTGYRTWNNNI